MREPLTTSLITGNDMELVQARIVTEDVERLAGFYASLVGAAVALNGYYVEVPAGPMSVGFSRRGFTFSAETESQVILDFQVDDADAEYGRIDRLDVDWVMRPATQPWGSRAMIFRDPEGNLVNVFSR